MIRAVISDWGGVLMRTVDVRPRMVWEKRLGLPWSALAGEFFSSPVWARAQRKPLSQEEIWAEWATSFDLRDGDIAALRHDFWAGDRLDPDMVDLLRELRDEGLTLALLSNHMVELLDLLEELDVLDLFDVRAISAYEGVAKPDATFFELILERLDVAPEEAFFVDDWRGHVQAARRLGIQAERFRGVRALRRAMAQTGLPVIVPSLEPIPGLRSVIFDWGGVFAPLNFIGEVGEWEDRLGLEEGKIADVLWGVEWKQFETGAMTPESFDAHVARGLGLPDREAVQDFYRRFYSGEQIEERLVEAVRALRGRYRIALLTNAYPGQAEAILERHGFDMREEFDVYVNSAEVGMAKPNPAIYRLVLDRLEVAPEEALFVDDMVRNTDGAELLGIHTLVFTDPASGLSDLADLLGHGTDW